MNKPQVYVTREIPEKGLALIAEECDMRVNRLNRGLTKEEIIENSKNCAGILTLLNDTIDKEVIESIPELKVISNYAVGYNNIDIESATDKGIIICNTPGVLTNATADLAWSLLMAAARRIVESDHFVREGKFKGWAPKLLLGKSIYGKTLGIIGMGRIGTAVARRGKGFNMRVVYNKRNPLSGQEEKELGVEYKDIDELLKISDYISINAPLNEKTHHLIDEEEFKKMKDTAIIINTGRGPIINEEALVTALREGQIAGAGLDVYENEPEVHPGLIELDNVVLTPHTGSGTVETRDEMAVIAARNLINALKGGEIPHVVNPGVLS